MKRMSKKLGVICGVCLCSMMLFSMSPLPVYASGESEAAEDNSRSTNLEWYYKYIDGVLYMRLWNHSTGKWVTDWVPAVG